MLDYLFGGDVVEGEGLVAGYEGDLVASEGEEEECLGGLFFEE